MKIAFVLEWRSLFDLVLSFVFGSRLLGLHMATRYVLTTMHLDRTGHLDSSQAEHDALKSAIEGLRHIADVEEKFATFVDNYFELEQELLSEALGVLVFFSVETSVMRKSQILISRRFINVLTSTRLYLDSLPKHAASLLDANRTLKNSVTDAPSKAYDAYLGYRVMEALRNYCQHESLPVHNWSTGVQKDMSVEPPRNRYSVSPALDIDRLANSKFKQSVLNELRDLKGRLGLKPFVREYVQGVGEVHQTFRDATAKLMKEWFELIGKTRLRYEAAFPSDSSLGLESVPLDDQGILAGRPIYLSKNLLEYIEHLQRRTHSMANFARRSVEY